MQVISSSLPKNFLLYPIGQMLNFAALYQVQKLEF